MTTARVTQDVVEALVSAGTINAKVTQEVAEVLVSSTVLKVNASQIVVEVLCPVAAAYNTSQMMFAVSP